MPDERTVLSQIESRIWHVATQTQRVAETACDALGLDPDMPFEQFARWLRYGKKFDAVSAPPADRISEWYAGWHWLNAEISAGDDR